MSDLETRISDTVQGIIDEVKNGEPIFKFSIGYSWTDDCTDGEHLARRQAALEAVRGVLVENMEAIVLAARAEAQTYLDAWIAADKHEEIKAAASILEKLEVPSNVDLH